MCRCIMSSHNMFRIVPSQVHMTHATCHMAHVTCHTHVDALTNDNQNCPINSPGADLSRSRERSAASRRKMSSPRRMRGITRDRNGHTSHGVYAHHITETSHHITSYHITSHDIAAHLVASYRVMMTGHVHDIPSHPIPSLLSNSLVNLSDSSGYRW